jgi:hypothetical protein
LTRQAKGDQSLKVYYNVVARKQPTFVVHVGGFASKMLFYRFDDTFAVKAGTYAVS